MAKTKEAPAEAKKAEALIYCGPNLPRAKIIINSVYRNGLPPNIAALVEKIPEIGKLLVPVSALNETRKRIATQGTEENRLYQAILAKRRDV